MYYLYLNIKRNNKIRHTVGLCISDGDFSDILSAGHCFIYSNDSLKHQFIKNYFLYA